MRPTLNPTTLPPISANDRIPTRGRLVLVEHLYHQQPGDPPTVVESRWSRWLASAEQPHVRRITVGEQWQAVDTSWIGSDCFMLRISNEEGRHLQTIPTEQQQKDTDERIVELGVASEPTSFGQVVHLFARILPGLDLRFCPTDVSRLRIRCLKNPSRCNVAAYPN